MDSLCERAKRDPLTLELESLTECRERHDVVECAGEHPDSFKSSQAQSVIGIARHQESSSPNLAGLTTGAVAGSAEPQVWGSPTMGRVANQRIWAPWRLDYVKDASKDSEEECIFCAALEAGDDEANLIVHRGERAFVILNKFPYTNGHLMVAPFEHVATLPQLDAETVAELMALTQRAMKTLEERYSPHGYNVGFNQGRVAGAGVEHHIHMHVVPRWGGDTNFMPVLADTRVMPQSLEQSYAALQGAFD